MLPIFLAALANIIGLGVIVPLLPFYAAHYGAGPAEAAWLFAVFSLAQFLTAPLWGRLSDRIGRKPVIAISFAGSVAAYLWLAFADDLAAIYLARIFAGVMNGWLATSQAYVADITEESERAKGMGMLGAAFGVGFVIGPALGGYLVGGEEAEFRLAILIAAGGSMAAFLLCLGLLKEPDHRHSQVASGGHFLSTLFSIKILGVLVLLYFSVFFVFSGMESTYALWCEAALGMGPRLVGYYLTFAGVCGVIVQGWLVSVLVRRVGEGRLVVFGLACLAAGLGGLPLATSGPGMLPAIALLSIGFGFANPSLQSLISRAVPENITGGAMGIAQSANSLARIFGPIWAGFAFASIGRDWPFFSGALLLGPVFLVALLLVTRFSRAR